MIQTNKTDSNFNVEVYGTDLEFDISNVSGKYSEKNFSKFKKALKEKNIDFAFDGANQKPKLVNKEKFFIYEDDFIEKCNDLELIVKRLSKKNYDNWIEVYNPKDYSFEKKEDFDTSDRSNYENVINDNIIRDIDIKELKKISINSLNESLNTKKESSSLIIDFFILLALATEIDYQSNKITAKFKADGKIYEKELNIYKKNSEDEGKVGSKGKKEKNSEEEEKEKDPPLKLYNLYDWIFNHNEYKDSYRIKLKIARKLITRRRSLEDIDTLVEECKLAYERIITEKTDKYFEQINKLKDDFLVLSSRKNSALRTLNITFFTWLGSLGVYLFNIIDSYHGKNILYYFAFSRGTKKSIIILMFIIALIFVFCGYSLEIHSLKKEYEVIKRVYQKDIFLKKEQDRSVSKLKKLKLNIWKKLQSIIDNYTKLDKIKSMFKRLKLNIQKKLQSIKDNYTKLDKIKSMFERLKLNIQKKLQSIIDNYEEQDKSKFMFEEPKIGTWQWIVFIGILAILSARFILSLS